VQVGTEPSLIHMAAECMLYEELSLDEYQAALFKFAGLVLKHRCRRIPVEPTEAMLKAVSDQFDADVSSGIGFNPQTLCRAMLNAK